MKEFYLESSLDSWEEDRKPINLYEKADLSGLENVRGLEPFRRPRSVSERVDRREEDIDWVRKDLLKRAAPNADPHLFCEVHAAPNDPGSHNEIWNAAKDAMWSAAISVTPQLQKALDMIVDEVLRNLTSEAVVVIDHALGLVWEVPGSHLPAVHAMGQARAACLKVAHFAGFSDWHLPTLDELSSLVYLLREDHPSAFDSLGQFIWTADREGLRPISVNVKTCRTGFHEQLNDHCPRTVCVASVGSRTR